MRVLVIGNTLNTSAVVCAAREEGLELCFLTSAQASVTTIQERFRASLAGCDHGGQGLNADCPIWTCADVVVPVSAENLAAGVGNVPARDAEQMGVYFAYGGNENLRHGFRLLRRLAGEETGDIPAPAPVPLDSIYTPDGHLYPAAEEFFTAQGGEYECYYHTGAADLMERVQNLFDTQCVCENIPAQTLDDVARQYLLDEQMQTWFRENNAYALEEAGRRFLELNSRGKWNGDPDVLRALRRAYLKAEGDLEDGVSGLGDIQAGNVDVIDHEQVAQWNRRLRETDELMNEWKK